MKQVKPLGAFTPKYAEDERYPGKLMVAMEDGRVLHYTLQDEQTNGHFVEAMEILRRLPMYGGRKYRRGQKEPAL